jgi:hypothetical protein
MPHAVLIVQAQAIKYLTAALTPMEQRRDLLRRGTTFCVKDNDARLFTSSGHSTSNALSESRTKSRCEWKYMPTVLVPTGVKGVRAEACRGSFAAYASHNGH